jgi:hypothetical protein
VADPVPVPNRVSYSLPINETNARNISSAARCSSCVFTCNFSPVKEKTKVVHAWETPASSTTNTVVHAWEREKMDKAGDKQRYDAGSGSSGNGKRRGKSRAQPDAPAPFTKPTGSGWGNVVRQPQPHNSGSNTSREAITARLGPPGSPKPQRTEPKERPQRREKAGSLSSRLGHKVDTEKPVLSKSEGQLKSDKTSTSTGKKIFDLAKGEWVIQTSEPPSQPTQPQPSHWKSKDKITHFNPVKEQPKKEVVSLAELKLIYSAEEDVDWSEL